MSERLAPGYIEACECVTKDDGYCEDEQIGAVQRRTTVKGKRVETRTFSFIVIERDARRGRKEIRKLLVPVASRREWNEWERRPRWRFTCGAPQR